MINYLIIALVFLAGGGVWYFWTRGKRRSKPERVSLVPEDGLPSSGHEKQDTDAFIDDLVSVEARVYDNKTRTVKNETIPAAGVRQARKDHGNLGRRWFRENQWRYAMVRTTEGLYVPLDNYMSLSLKNPPERLHRALQQQETATFYRPKDNRNLLAKYGAYLLFAAAVIVILFLWGANMMR